MTITSYAKYLIADNAPINAKVNFATSCVSTASVPTNNVICANNSPVDEVLRPEEDNPTYLKNDRLLSEFRY